MVVVAEVPPQTPLRIGRLSLLQLTGKGVAGELGPLVQFLGSISPYNGFAGVTAEAGEDGWMTP